MSRVIATITTCDWCGDRVEVTGKFEARYWATIYHYHYKSTKDICPACLESKLGLEQPK